MQAWLKQHAWALVIAGATIASTFVLYGYRLDALEAQIMNSQSDIRQLSDTNTQLQIGLAKIQTDIEYIKVQITKLAQ